MKSTTDHSHLRPVHRPYLDAIRVGSHLYYWPEGPHRPSVTGEYTLYSVLEVIDGEVTVTGAFDETESKKSVSVNELLSGDWFYNDHVSGGGDAAGDC